MHSFVDIGLKYLQVISLWKFSILRLSFQGCVRPYYNLLVCFQKRSNDHSMFWNFSFRYVKKKFEELYFQSTTPDRVDRVFKIYRTTALDQKLVKKTFKLVDETLRRRNLFEAGLLWTKNNFFESVRFWTLKSWMKHPICWLLVYHIP